MLDYMEIPTCVLVTNCFAVCNDNCLGHYHIHHSPAIKPLPSQSDESMSICIDVMSQLNNTAQRGLVAGDTASIDMDY